MNISGIRPFEAIGYYSNLNIGRNLDVVSDASEQQGAYLEEAPKEQYVGPRPEQKENAFEFAKKYNPNATYEMKGADSDLKSLDKAIEMPKVHRDQALRQYQVFVGNKPRISAIEEATKELENFSL
ncbi:hypothetical protein SAMN02910358_00405 [Lachnospiraceae bacterium XBB1006]|nr:hypothetical protein SAMN02910358_00405 [Lachnospiraceae bacterium XBB1006]